MRYLDDEKCFFFRTDREGYMEIVQKRFLCNTSLVLCSLNALYRSILTHLL
jgi:hypothetical protein